MCSFLQCLVIFLNFLIIFFILSIHSTYKQLLLVQDGKIHGRDPVFAIISRAAALPEATKNHDIQKNEFILQLGQVSTMHQSMA